MIKSWVTNCEEGAMEQAWNLTAMPNLFKWVALMPDCHEGYGMPIGGVVALIDAISPGMVGVDIGCGMAARQFSIKRDQLPTELLKIMMGEIRKRIPVGFNKHDTPRSWWGFADFPDVPVLCKELENASLQLGTLGGGNHFLEIQVDQDDYVWVMVHSGSRNLGKQMADHYCKLAQEHCAKWHAAIPNRELAFFPSDDVLGREYLEVMQFCLDFAAENRNRMLQEVTEIFDAHLGATTAETISCHHNFAALENHMGKNVWVHRKGATMARKDQLGIIPGSMGAASYIVKGLGNPESFMSCSHGAGRRMGRKAAIKNLDLAGEQAKMQDIVHGLRSQADLDEAPGAYKDIQEVMANQQDLVEIRTQLRAIGSIKG